ncbi:exosome component 10 [Anoplophora glabripennis]|uniref:exosome component 10 n=1 Tax=Anoplophora glabripennis TaxID=217634 RepID=UPI000874ED40|nr:exosome component 10 [Anoplophora glabripennis]
MPGQGKEMNEVSKAKIEPKDEILPGYPTIEHFTKEGYKILMEAIKNSNSLPNGKDYNFYNTFDSFTNIMNEEGNAILKQINSILRSNNIEGNICNRVLEEKTELMIEANDVILDRVANNIDEMNGIRKIPIEPVLIQTVSAQIPINGSWNRVNNATFSVSSSITSEHFKKNQNAIRLLTAKNILRPQKFFKDKIVNSCKYPWEPRIKEKPNSLKPLAIFLEETENGEEYSHPYEFELDKFVPLQDQLKKVTPTRPLKVEDTPLIEIQSDEQINELLETLRNCKEFAIDLEHHSYRSFMGITCLMQISTAEKDYLIDTLALRDKLWILNEVFTKSSIVKIFHGADMDIQWLQRDLSLYVVNMFDTYQAAKQLGYSGLSLAYLMQRFCNFMPNKHFQLADWRIRPLPEELKAYAREDTHYLIYIYHMLRNELLDKANGQNLLLSVINNSTKICKKRYFRPVLRDDSHLDFYRKSKRLFDNRQLYALKELYKWRDQISREEDESTGYVLPNHMLLQISETLPREMQGILACCSPIPPLVRANLLELHQIILRAKEQPLEKPIMKEDTRARGTTLKISKINIDSPLHCPHDLTKSNEFRDDLPTLMGNNSAANLSELIDKKLEIENTHSSRTVFDPPDNSSEQEIDSEALKKIHSIGFLGPFERYKLVKPFIQAEEERLASEKSKNDEQKKSSQSVDVIVVDNRTDEERIESIREHFLSLARKVVPVVEETEFNQSLVQMGGSKKRKRDSSLEDNLVCFPSTSVQTPIPNINPANSDIRKRKSIDLPQETSPNKIKKIDGQNQTFVKKKNRRKKKGKNLASATNQDKQTNQEKHNQNLTDFNSVGDRNRSENQSSISEENSSRVDTTRVDGIKGKQKNRKRKFKMQALTNPQKLNPEFTPFDYASVDFRQFQGGAEIIQKQQQLKSSLKFKRRPRNNKSNNNRSMTFGKSGKKLC